MLLTCLPVAVLAFKAVYSLEMTRRQNDKRIIALYKEMKDMVEVLVRYSLSTPVSFENPDDERSTVG